MIKLYECFDYHEQFKKKKYNIYYTLFDDSEI